MKKTKLQQHYWVLSYLRRNKKSLNIVSEQCLNDFKENASLHIIENIIECMKAEIKDEKLSKYMLNVIKKQSRFLEEVNKKF
jgi:hypothetical protein